MKNTLSLIFISFIMTSCIGFDRVNSEYYAINVDNQTNDVVYVCITCSDYLEGENPINYLDTSYQSKRINKYTNKYIHDYNAIGKNNDGSKNVLCKDDKVRLFILSDSTMRNNPWWRICGKQMYERKFTLTKKELDSMNYEFIYTGKDMKGFIYPEKE